MKRFAATFAALLALCWTLAAHADPVWGSGSSGGGSGTPTTRTISTTAPLAGGGDLSADRTLSITAASGVAAGSMSAADFTKLSGLPSSAVPTTRTVSTTSPLTGGGALSGDLTLVLQAATGAQNGYLASADYTKIQNAVPNTRTVSTSGPLGGGGALSSNLTLTCATCAIGPGTSTATAVPKFSSTDGLTLAASAGVFIDASDRLGLGTSSPTHSLTLASTGTGATLYNTTDQTTNFERGYARWTSNVFTLGTENGGTGTQRTARFQAGANNSLSVSTGVTISASGGNSTNPVLLIANDSNFISTSSVQTGFSVIGTINQTSGTGGYNGVLCNPTLTAVGSAGAKCFRAQNGGNDRWWVDATSGVEDSDSTNTAAGTTGAQTINKPSGTVNVAASASSVVVTNSLVTTSTILNVQARTNDSTCAVKNYVPAAGSFTINMSANCTAETSVGFKILDKN